ncbi:MAG: aquaporin [Candidatus Nanopelagicales bacterium]
MAQVIDLRRFLGFDVLMAKKLIAEFIGTFTLVFLAVGAAVAGIGVARDATANADFIVPASGTLGIAIAFGFVLMFLVYAIGGISGCHINPAVTIAMMATKKIEIGLGLAYMVVQVLGAILGGAALKLMVTSFGVLDTTGGLGTNSYGANISMGGAFFIEVVLTALFVFVILMVTDKWAVQSMAGVAIGMSLVAVHLFGIPLDGTSVNPARSIGPALFEGGAALSQLWLFIVAPLIGGLVAAGLWAITRDENAGDDDKALSDIPEQGAPA